MKNTDLSSPVTMPRTSGKFPSDVTSPGSSIAPLPPNPTAVNSTCGKAPRAPLSVKAGHTRRMAARRRRACRRAMPLYDVFTTPVYADSIPRKPAALSTCGWHEVPSCVRGDNARFSVRHAHAAGRQQRRNGGTQTLGARPRAQYEQRGARAAMKISVVGAPRPSNMKPAITSTTAVPQSCGAGASVAHRA